MDLMNSHGIATPQGYPASTPEEAVDIFSNKMNSRTFSVIVKLFNLCKNSFSLFPNFFV